MRSFFAPFIKRGLPNLIFQLSGCPSVGHFRWKWHPFYQSPRVSRKPSSAERDSWMGWGEVLGGQKRPTCLMIPIPQFPIGRPLLTEVAPLLSKAAYLVDALNSLPFPQLIHTLAPDLKLADGEAYRFGLLYSFMPFFQTCSPIT